MEIIFNTIDKHHKKLQYLLIFFFSLSILKGIRMPNLWTSSHYIFNYDLGFMRRGLTGAFFSLILGDGYYHYFTIFIIQAVIFAGILFFLLKLGLAIFKQKKEFLFIGLIFFSSPALTFLAHEIGYFEQIGLLLILSLFYFSYKNKITFKLSLLLCYAIALLLIFTHEAQIIFYGTILYVYLLFKKVNFNLKNIALKDIIKVFLIFALPILITTFCVMQKGTLAQKKISGRIHYYQQKTDFKLRKDAFAPLCSTSKGNLKIMKKEWSKPKNQRLMVFSLLLHLPCLFGLFYFTFFISKIKLKKSVFALLIIAVFAPLLIHFVGWDTNRWNSFLCINLFLIIILLQQSNHVLPMPLKARKHTFSILIIVLALNLCASNFLFDGYKTKHYPFDQHMNNVLDIYDGHKKIIPKL